MDETKPLQEKDQLVRLDWVFHLMAKHAYDGLEIEPAWVRIQKEHPTIHMDISYRHQVFQKLIYDGYLKFNEFGDNRYWITLEGVIFSDYGNGGYSASEKEKKELSRRVVRLENWNLRLYVLLVVATFGLLIFEIYKFLYENNPVLSCP